MNEEGLLWRKEFKEFWPRNRDPREEGEDEGDEDDEDKVWLGKEKKKPRWLVLIGFMMVCDSSNKLIPWFIAPISLSFTQKLDEDEIVREREVFVLLDILFDFGLRVEIIQSIHVSVSINI